MKIFVSWSKPKSQKAAFFLKELISNTLSSKQAKIDIFISSEDIQAGARWFDTISEQLESSDFAIICFTKENKDSKWLDFESGAIAFNVKKAPVCPFLIDFNELEPKNPLVNFQVTRNDKNDIFKLIKTIRDISKSPFDDRQLRIIFDKEYKIFNKELSKILKIATEGFEIMEDALHIYPPNISHVIKNKIFIGMPMAGIDKDKYSPNRDILIEIIDILKKSFNNSSIYSPVINIPTFDDFEGQEKSIELDFTELKSSEYYMFIYPEKVVSSVLVEIGYAIALMKKTVVFVRNRKDLPFMLERADHRNNCIKIYDYLNFEDLKKQIIKDGKLMFNFSDN